MITTRTTLAIVATFMVLGSRHAMAQANLQITEMWPGGLAGTEATSDWFEITNFGDAAATGLEGNLYYDDNSDDPTSDDPLLGVDSIDVGESVVFLVSWEDDWSTAAEAIAAFESMWGAPAGDLSSVQIGWVAGGGGLGGGGDAVNIFDGNTATATTLDREEFLGTSEATWVSDPNGVFNFPLDAAIAGVWGAYVGNLPASDDPSVGNAIGSPGVVPEPASFGLTLGSLFFLWGLLRRR